MFQKGMSSSLAVAAFSRICCRFSLSSSARMNRTELATWLNISRLSSWFRIGFLSPESLGKARNLGVSPQTSLDNNDGHGFFRALGDPLVTGPTLTNVNDFRAMLIL